MTGAPIFEQLAGEHLVYADPPTVELPLIEVLEVGRISVENFQALPVITPADHAPTGPIPVLGGGTDGSR